MHRVHRSLWERMLYYAVFECTECGELRHEPRRITFYLGAETRCPNCGTERLRRLQQRDRIDRMYKGPLNVIAAVLGGRLYHCAFCRIQFYDFRTSSYCRATRKAKLGV